MSRKKARSASRVFAVDNHVRTIDHERQPWEVPLLSAGDRSSAATIWLDAPFRLLITYAPPVGLFKRRAATFCRTCFMYANASA
jgi:hypothetical protein